MVASDETESSESDAVSRATYVPGCGKVALVCNCEGLLGVTGTGPPKIVQFVVSVPVVGFPSSVAVPLSCTVWLTTAILLVPAETMGGALDSNGCNVGVGVSTPTGGMNRGVAVGVGVGPEPGVGVGVGVLVNVGVGVGDTVGVGVGVGGGVVAVTR